MLDVKDEEVEIARKAIEDTLIDFRDSRISMPMRGNGLVVREPDGSESSVIRMSTDGAIRIAINVINKHREKKALEFPKQCCKVVDSPGGAYLTYCNREAQHWYRHNGDICSYCDQHNYVCGEEIKKGS